MYDGGREKGRPHGRGSLVWPNKQGTYDGDFAEGRRHGYGVMSSFLGEKEVVATGATSPKMNGQPVVVK